MTRLLLVRHAEPAASWEEHADPGLSPVGAGQAQDLARRLAPRGPQTIVVSPLARTQETAEPLARRWDRKARLDVDVGEIPTPSPPVQNRGEWLRDVLARGWSELDTGARAWRDRVLQALRRVDEDAVVVTHFVAINVAVGAATDDDRVWCCSPAHCSITELDVRDGRLALVSVGAESVTRIG